MLTSVSSAAAATEYLLPPGTEALLCTAVGVLHHANYFTVLNLVSKVLQSRTHNLDPVKIREKGRTPTQKVKLFFSGRR